MKEIQQSLQNIGLHEKEAGLYLASLNLGEASMSSLAKQAGLKRSTAYLTFKSLEGKGLMGSFKMRSGLKFVATRPEAMKIKMQQQLEELDSILPGLKVLAEKSGDQPKITFYEGKQGYLVALHDTLKISNKTLRQIASITELHKTITEDYDVKHYMPKRIAKRIFIKALYTQDISERLKNREHGKELREVKYLPAQYPIKTSTLIYDSKVVITTSKKELITVMIESEEIAAAEKAKFDLIWDIVVN